MAEGESAMKYSRSDLQRGSGNVFRDFQKIDADLDQFKAILAAEIIKVLDKEQLTVRAAHVRTGVAAADFSRIRRANLNRFTVDRLFSIVNRLGSHVDISIKVRRAKSSRFGRARAAI
jgi:predicted XRE-type DNA-binding protein